MAQWRAFIIILLLMTVRGVAAQETTTPTTYSIDHDGLTRRYQLFAPELDDEETPIPLVIALHGNAASGTAMAIQTQLHITLDDMFVAYPDSATNHWDDGRATFGVPRGASAIDDVGFINALIEDISQAYSVSDVYLVGYDSGGLLAYRLACAQPFAGVAVIGALMWEYHDVHCSDDGASVPILIMMGENDVTYQPDTIIADSNQFSFKSSDETLAYWQTRNACEDATVQDNILTFEACAASLVFYSVFGGGHNWFRTGDYQLNQTGVNAAEVIKAFFEEDNLPTQAEPFADTPRDYSLFVPHSYEPDTPMPMIISLHGRPGTGTGTAWLTDMLPMAEREGIMLVHPNGLDFGWNSMVGIDGFVQNTTDDIGFLATVVDDISQDFNVGNVYIMGFSNGGYMTLRLACESTEYAAFAVVGATMPPHFEAYCADSEPAPIIFFHGTNDVIIPFDGGEGLALSVLDMTGYFVLHNNCNPEGESRVIDTVEDDETRALHFSFYDECDAPVELYAIEGGGHNFPGVPGRLNERVSGNVSEDIMANELIWEFFAQFE